MTGVNEISALHDPLLVHILSYLPTKKAVGTSALSKRWKNVWASVPVLEFDFAHFWSEDIFSRTKYETYVSEHSECHDNFVRLIDAVLASRQGQQIDRFTLVWKYQVKNYHYHGHPVRRWISLVLQQNPQVLSIYVQPSVADVEVPDMAFTCSSLVEMKLQVDNRSPEVLEPKLVNLPSLRRLNLGYFTIETDFMSKLLLGCPKLEELELYACGLNLSQISCNNLKSLVFDGCCNFAEIRVSIPSLQYLKVTVVSSQTAGFVFENMSSLVQASVSFITDAQFETVFYNREANILNGLSRVKNLDVVLHGSEAEGMLEHALKNCAYFGNLKAVHFENFDGYLICCLDMIDLLVQQSPVLENLTFYCCKDGSDEFELLKELREIVRDHGNCQLVECKQGRIYESLDEIQKLLLRYMERFEKMKMEIPTEEEEEEEEDDDDDDDDDAGGVGGGGGGGVGGGDVVGGGDDDDDDDDDDDGVGGGDDGDGAGAGDGDGAGAGDVRGEARWEEGEDEAGLAEEEEEDVEEEEEDVEQ